jgi:hypothetical protein
MPAPAQRQSAAAVFVGGNHEAALGDIGSRRHFSEAQQRSGLDRALERAGHHHANGNLQPAHGLADHFGLRAALVVELTLCRDVLHVEGIGVGLVRIGRAVAKDDDVSAEPEVVEPIRLCRPVRDDHRKKHDE